MSDLNPQAREMADESMVRNLDAQARAIWPQEVELFGRYNLSGSLRILDAGCGPGEITSRLAELFPDAELLGVDSSTRISSSRAAATRGSRRACASSSRPCSVCRSPTTRSI